MEHRASLFEQLLIMPDRPWLALGGALAFLLIPFAGVVLAEDPGLLLNSERWRGLLVAPVMIVYIAAVAPVVERAWRRVYTSLRPVVRLADVAYDQLISSATTVRRRNELLVLAVGGALGLLRVGYTVEGMPTWLDVYLLVSTALLFGFLALVIFLTFARTQVTATILRQPLRIDPCEITAFMPIGEQGLILALVFIGGTTLSLIFSALDPAVFSQVSFWLIYLPIALVPVAVFFLAMRPTHRVLADAKESQLLVVRKELYATGRQLLEQLAQKQDTGDVSQQVLALAALEQRLQVARTWPYNTTMLRTLFVSVMAPTALLLLRKILQVM